ncbi:helix-turn-helix domain-containing protein [Kitasatospora sp. NPDC088134]|uniref:helix-turn-helix domain-containing protein n=1 Tax=Kitasatospora sp. NPDC088134 TaxID=3364071 RepID=UPI0037F7B941
MFDSVRMRDRRKRLGLTLAQLAVPLGVHETTVGRWEGGAVEPSVSRVVALAAALRVPFEALLKPVPAPVRRVYSAAEAVRRRQLGADREQVGRASRPFPYAGTTAVCGVAA